MPKEKDRMSLDFPKGTKKKVEELRIFAGLSTLTEVFRQAISVYEFLLKQQEAGWRIVLEKKGEDKEVFRII